MLFARMLQRDPACLHGRGQEMLIGDMSKKDRLETLQSFHRKDHKFVAFMTFDLGGVGHNFQMFDHVIFFDRHFNPQVCFTTTTRPV